MKSGMQWPIGVATVLVLAIVGNIYIAVRANDDPSVHIESDYYQKAVRFDADQALRRRSERLGWRVTIEAVRTAANDAKVTATLVDSAGRSVSGAVVRIAAHAVARSNDVLTATAVEAGGRFVAALPVMRGGLWQFDIEVVRGADRFIASQRIDLGSDRP